MEKNIVLAIIVMKSIRLFCLLMMTVRGVMMIMSFLLRFLFHLEPSDAFLVKQELLAKMLKSVSLFNGRLMNQNREEFLKLMSLDILIIPSKKTAPLVFQKERSEEMLV